MQTLIQIASFLINTLGTLYLLAILLRFMLQLARADFYNPFSQLIVKLTNPLLIPFRRVIPGLWGVDFAAIVLALVFHAIALELLIFVGSGQIALNLLIIAWSFIGNALFMITIYLISLIIMAIASFIAPYSAHPILVLIRQMNEPLLRPIRRFIRPAGGMDFSVMFASIGLIVIQMVLVGIANGVSTPLHFILGWFL